MFITPILFIVFNRPQTTNVVFAKIKEIKPKYLYIAADGPRENVTSDIEKCASVREIVSQIDWDCELKTLFRTENLGCGLGPATAISWFFDHVEEGIILEDDCLPDITFFSFCQTLLNYYRNSDLVMHISGNSYHSKSKKESYYFSNYIHPPHGWATWRNRWNLYDYEMQNLNAFIQSNGFNRILKNKNEVEFWKKCFLKTQLLINKDVWDDQWQFTLWLNNGLAIRPHLNLVENIGYGSDATHTKDISSNTNNNKAFCLINIIHPSEIKLNHRDDIYLYKTIYNPKPVFYIRWKNLLLKELKRLLLKLSTFQKLTISE